VRRYPYCLRVRLTVLEQYRLVTDGYTTTLYSISIASRGNKIFVILFLTTNVHPGFVVYRSAEGRERRRVARSRASVCLSTNLGLSLISFTLELKTQSFLSTTNTDLRRRHVYVILAPRFTY